MIRIEHVSYSYAGNGVRALDDVSLQLSPGEFLVLLGANGSGKSTLARLTNGLAAPGTGRVLVDGLDTTDTAAELGVRSRVGMVFQNPDDQIVATSVEDDVAFGPENLGLPRSEIRARVDEAIAEVGLRGLERREPHLLSGGQKQRLAIAGALAMHPTYLVLDEPTAMIDAQGRREVARALERVIASGRGVLLITHDLADVARADRVAVLSQGTVVFDGSVAELLGDASRLAGWGLELPPVAELADLLRARGLHIPTETLVPETLLDALCR